MRNRYDVVIIGAGPAGLKCAEQLRDSNLSVLLIEKNKIIGPKICAGGLTRLVPDYDIPEGSIRSFTNQIIFIDDKKYDIKLANPLKTVAGKRGQRTFVQTYCGNERGTADHSYGTDGSTATGGIAGQNGKFRGNGILDA